MRIHWKNMNDWKMIAFLWQIFVLFEIIYNSKSYFINYILQTNKQTNKQTHKKATFYHAIYPSLWLLKSNCFCLLPRLIPIPPLNTPTLRLNHVKCWKVLVFKTFSTCCHFLLYIVCFLHCLLIFFLYVFKLSWFLQLRISLLMIWIS